MKLLMCTDCRDILKLNLERRECQCGQAWARYVMPETLTEKHPIECGGTALILGIETKALEGALKSKIANPKGNQRVNLFLLPEPCSTVHRQDAPESECRA